MNKLAGVVLLLCTISGLAMADDRDGERGQHGQRPPAFADLDSNSDGVISSDEAASIPPLAEHFSEMDTDGDGVLTEEEMSAHMPRPPKADSNDR